MKETLQKTKNDVLNYVNQFFTEIYKNITTAFQSYKAKLGTN